MGCSQEKIQNSCWLIRLGISVVEFTSRLQNGSLGRLVCLYIERAAMCGFLGNVLEMLNFATHWQTSWVTLVYTMSLIGIYTYFGFIVLYNINYHLFSNAFDALLPLFLRLQGSPTGTLARCGTTHSGAR